MSFLEHLDIDHSDEKGGNEEDNGGGDDGEHNIDAGRLAGLQLEIVTTVPEFCGVW